MLERTEKAIDKLVATAVEAATYLKPPELAPTPSAAVEELDLGSTTGDPIEVALPDGRTAKLRM